MSLKDVVGHEVAVKTLRMSISSGRVATSYLFAGEQGVGKRYTAVNFIKALNCRGGKAGPPALFSLPEEGDTKEEQEPDACDACPSCAKIDSGTHPDFITVEPDGAQIKVEQIRRLEEILTLKPHEGVKKAAIVDSAEKLHPAAANAFLKTLEEPPAGSIIILVTAAPGLLLETIRSRCTRVNFAPLGPADCQAVLQARGFKGSVPDATRLSQGRPGLALRTDLAKERDRALKLLKEILEPGGKAPWKDREDIERWFDITLALLRDMAVFKCTNRPGELLNADISDTIAAMCAETGLKVIIECYDQLRAARDLLRFNLNKGITCNYAGTVVRRLWPTAGQRAWGRHSK